MQKQRALWCLANLFNQLTKQITVENGMLQKVLLHQATVGGAFSGAFTGAWVGSFGGGPLRAAVGAVVGLAAGGVGGFYAGGYYVVKKQNKNN